MSFEPPQGMFEMTFRSDFECHFNIGFALYDILVIWHFTVTFLALVSTNVWSANPPEANVHLELFKWLYRFNCTWINFGALAKIDACIKWAPKFAELPQNFDWVLIVCSSKTNVLERTQAFMKTLWEFLKLSWAKVIYSIDYRGSVLTLDPKTSANDSLTGLRELL